MRAFDETITWIRFRTELRQAPPSFWLLLGECVALIEQLKGAPLPPSESRSLDQELLAYGLLARVVLDGSPLRAEQVLHHLEGQLRLPPSQAHLRTELDNLLHTGQRLHLELASGPVPLDAERILGYQAALTEGMPDAHAGWRTTPPSVAPVQAVPAEMVAIFMEELCDWLTGPELAPPSPDEAPHYALLHSLLAELYIAWIQPFGRTDHQVAGLVAQHLLAQGGLHGSWIHLPAVHFHRTRPEYQRQIAQAAQGAGDPIPFLAYALRGLLEGLKELTTAIRTAQADGQWRAHVEALLDAGTTPQHERQRHLLLALGEESGPIPLGRIAALTPELARLYAGVSGKTLQRDIEALDTAGAVQRGPDGVRARREIVLGFRG